MSDVFMSYSRRDAKFVNRLADDLRERGKDVWLDVGGIRDAEVFPDALRRAIESSHAFLFVISPDSVSSEFCELEVAHASELNKRIVPLALHAVPDEEIPVEIRFRNWIPVGDDTGIDRVIAAIDTDLDWEQQHTRLTVKALEWEQSGRDGSFVLRGSDLAAAEQWLAAGADKDPGPTSLEQEYLLAARQAASRRQRILVGSSLTVAVIAIGLLIFALVSRGQAVSAETTAKSQALAAESQAQQPVDSELSILIAMHAVETDPTNQTRFALRAAVDASPIRYRLPQAPPQNCNPPTVVSVNGKALGGPGLAVRPDGRQIAEGLCDGVVRLVDPSSRRVERTLKLSPPAIQLAYSPDGSTLAVLAGHQLLAIDPATGRIRLRGPRLSGVTPLVFAPHTPIAAVVGPNGVSIWNVRTGTVRVFAGNLSRQINALPVSLAFSPDGARLAIAFNSGLRGQPGVLLYSVRDHRLIAADRSSPASVLAFSRDGRELAVGEFDAATGVGGIVIRDPRTLALERTVVPISFNLPSAIAFSSDGQRIAYGTAAGTGGVVLSASGQTVVNYAGPTASINAMAFTADARSVLTGSADGTVRVWRATGLELSTARIPSGLNTQIAADAGGFVSLIQSQGRGVVVQRWRLNGQPAAPPLVLSRTANVDAAFLGSEGRLAGVIPASPANSPARPEPVRIWNVTERRLIDSAPPAPVPSFAEPAISPNGASLVMAKARFGPPAASVSLDLVDPRTGRQRTLGSTSACASGYVAYGYNRAGSLVAAGTGCGQIAVYDVATGRMMSSFDIHAPLDWLALSPDGRRIAAAAVDGAITVADVATGGIAGRLSQSTHGVGLIAYSPNGHYLASAGLDGTLRIWDAGTLKELRVIEQPDPIVGVAFTPDSRDVLSWDGQNTVREWDACTDCENSAALLALARSRVTRSLTSQERRTFGVS